MSTVLRNPRFIGFESLDGTERFGIEDHFSGAPTARRLGAPTSLAARYASVPGTLPDVVGPLPIYGDWLPYTTFPSLGEGGTPLVPLPRSAERVGADAVWLKCEAANPTGSHKDRMTPLAVARAIEIGARGVACASSGNAAISLAAYAAACGLPCKVVVTVALSQPYRLLMERMGAELDVVETSLARWSRLESLTAEGWFPITNFALPPSGSNPFGVQGYRTIAFELAQQAGALDAVIVPTARGDLLWGIADGYKALSSAGLLSGPPPKLIAVEPFPRIERVLASHARASDRFEGRTAQFSTAGETTTDQAVRAVRDSGGIAISISDGEAEVAQIEAARQGHDLELSSAAALAALPYLSARGLAASRIAIMGTANSSREPAR